MSDNKKTTKDDTSKVKVDPSKVIKTKPVMRTENLSCKKEVINEVKNKLKKSNPKSE